MTDKYNTERPAAELDQGEVTVTRDETGAIVAVTRVDEDGRILSIIAEAEQQKAPEAVAPVAFRVHFSNGLPSEIYTNEGEALDRANQKFTDCRATVQPLYPHPPASAVPDGWKLVPMQITAAIACALEMCAPPDHPLHTMVITAQLVKDWQPQWDAALKAAPPAPAAQSPWKPIETAPTDGSTCIVTNGSVVGEAWFSQDNDGWWWANTHPTDATDGRAWNPTYWMPLPQLPEAKA